MYRGEYDKSMQLVDSVMKMFENTIDFGTKHAMMFYRALLYDIMEDFEAELMEVLKDYELAEMTESDYMRLQACVMLIHAYLRQNENKDAQKKRPQMLELLKKFSFKTAPLTLSLAEIVEAEFCYADSNWEEGNKKFQYGVQLIRNAQYGNLLEGVAKTWYGEHLARQGLNDDAKLEYSKALEIYRNLGNMAEAERVLKKLSSIE
jgi:tetratricopeptide (TPR) repeat protein